MEIGTVHCRKKENCFETELSSSRTKGDMTTRSRSIGGDDGMKNAQPHKKQVRRRLHTSRPYQEKLLDMAEARREIATALKHHRAAMRQANEQKEKQLQEQHHSQISPVQRVITENFNTSRDANTSFPGYSQPQSLCYRPAVPITHSMCPLPCSAPFFPQAAFDNLNFRLPDQPLGLNLNLHDFGGLETSLSPAAYSSSSPSSSSIPTQEASSFGKSVEMASDRSENSNGNCLHQMVEEDEATDVKWVGDEHRMEWNDSMANSAWWLKFSKTMEVRNERSFDPFDELMEFPDWSNSSHAILPQQFSSSSQESFHFHDLPRMDIGDIDGLDEHWLA